MNLNVVPFYAAALAVLFVGLSVRVIRGRNTGRLSLGVSGNADLERRVRVHGNFAEYVPFALLLLAMAELRGAAHLLLHLLCVALVAGRLAHAWGVSRANEDFRFRVAGVGATMTVIVAAALLIVLG